MDVALDYREPIDLAGLFAWLAARAVPGLETAGDSSYARTLQLPGGPAWFEVRFVAGELRLRARLTREQDFPLLHARVRHLFDLDADPVTVDSALTALPAIRPLVAATPGVRVAGCVDPHELLFRAMVGQQISVAAARTILTRVVTGLGEPAPSFAPGLTHMFPLAQAIADEGFTVLRGPKARRNALVGAAQELVCGRLRLDFDREPAALREALLALRGVGPWTADYVRMRVTGDPDVFLIGDGALRAGARRLGLVSDRAQLLAWAARAAPWRSYLTTHLWRVPAAPTSSSSIERAQS